MGFSVIPIIPGQKKPIVSWQQYQKQKPTKEQIVSWWSQTPQANVGIVTGEVSDLFVVDIDTEEGQQNLLQYGFEKIITPTVSTPRGGQHLYFKYPQGTNITIGAGKIKGTDFRGNGGYVLAPPSCNDKGKKYTWVIDLQTDLSGLTFPYINIINSSSVYRSVTRSEIQEKNLLQSVILFEYGTRDNDLFHTANCLVKGGMSENEIPQVLERLILSWGENPDKKWINAKIKSAMDRAKRKERNLTREVEDFIAVTSGYFTVTSCYMALQVVTKKDKGTVRQVLNRLNNKVIEKYGPKDGVYRKIETNFDFVYFDKNEPVEVEYPINLPLGLNDIAEISQGNIILVAGEYNVGKTSFLLNILKNNKNIIPIRYISSEMSKSEFKKRFATFGLPMSFWMQNEMTEYIKKSFDFHSVIKPDALNLLDYMEFRDSDYTKGAEYLTQIHDKLGTGVAVIAIQKKKGSRMPRSGDMVLEKPRLAISFSSYASTGENPMGVCEILKCKMPKLGKIDGKKLRFELQNRGSYFYILNDWGYIRF